MALFRTEAIEAQDRLHGEVMLAPPVSWQVLGFFLGGLVLLSILFLSLASYAQTATVTGEIDGDRGIVRIVPVRAGVITAVFVREGSRVRPGQIVARVSYATSDGSATLEQRRAAAVRDQGRALAGQQGDLQAEADARIRALRSANDAERQQLAATEDQIGQQTLMIATGAADLARMEEVAKNGFISKHQIHEREEALAEKRQGLMRLRAEQAGHRGTILQNEQQIAGASYDARVRITNLQRSRAQIAAEAAEDANVAEGAIVAPVAGTITGIEAHAGEMAGAGALIASLVPADTRLVARLAIPANAAGLIQPGQAMRLAIDAFPFQTYGTIAARLETLTRSTGGGERAASFVGRASIDDAVVRAYGRPQVLRPGMTLTARIVTRRRSLVQWLLDPLYAVARR